MNIADVDINGDVLSVSVPRETLRMECLSAGGGAVCWTAIAVTLSVVEIRQYDPSAVAGVIYFSCMAVLSLAVFCQTLRLFLCGKTYSFDRAMDEVRCNQKVVGKVSAIERFELRSLSGLSYAVSWPKIWIVFGGRRNVLLLRTLTIVNHPRSSKWSFGPSRDPIGEEACLAGRALCEVLSRFCDRAVV